MNNSRNFLYWSFGAGTWYGVRLRISWFLPLLLFYFWYELGWRFGGALFAGLFVSVLLHEIGHILASRALHGTGDEILLWPLGGLASVASGGSSRWRVVTAMGGPAVNLLLCALFLSAVHSGGYLPGALNPLILPVAPDQFGREHLLTDLQLVMFWMNWTLLLVNLIPAYPLDGGQAVRSELSLRVDGTMALELSIRLAYVVAFVLAVLALLVFKHVILLGIAFFLALVAMQESMHLHAGDSYDDSFMGYDFSQGYTSLEKSEKSRPEVRRGLIARWLEARRVEKQRRNEREQQQVIEQLDAILAKVHERGLGALTPSERRLLKRASDRFRGRGEDGPA
jgi:stage IV sporulation protein FB